MDPYYVHARSNRIRFVTFLVSFGIKRHVRCGTLSRPAITIGLNLDNKTVAHGTHVARGVVAKLGAPFLLYYGAPVGTVTLLVRPFCGDGGDGACLAI